MERETKTITLPVSKKEAVLRTFLTGRETRQLRAIFLNDAEFSSKGDEQELAGIKGRVIEQVENKAIELVVVSVDGSEDKILETILDLHSKDYTFLVKEINEIGGSEDFLDDAGK